MTYDLSLSGGREGEHETVARALRRGLRTVSRNDEIDYAMIAAREGTTEDEARRRAGIELDDERYGIAFRLYANGRASMTFTYGASGRYARELVARVFRHLRVLHTHGYVAFDAQLGREVDLAAGQAAMVRAYEAGTAQLDRMRARRRAPSA